MTKPGQYTFCQSLEATTAEGALISWRGGNKVSDKVLLTSNGIEIIATNESFGITLNKVATVNQEEIPEDIIRPLFIYLYLGW
jgi:hypothetical protein